MDVRLGDYIQEYSVRNKAEEDIPVYSVTNSEGFCTGYFDKEVASQDRSTYKIVPRGCFAYNPSRINVGSVDWQRTVDRVIVSPLYVVFSVSSEVLPQYLYYYLKSDVALTRIRAKATGSVRDNLKFSMLQEFPFKLRNRNDQKHIIEVLDTIHSMTKLYKKQLQTLDQLIKARFVEMFGDIRSNPLGYEKMKLGHTCKVVTGNTPSRSVSEYYGDYIEWIKTDNIVSGLLNPTKANESLSKEGMKVGKTVDSNSILMACIAGSVASIGRVCVTDRTVSFNQQINAIIPESYNTLFLYVMLQLSKEYLVEDISMALKGILSKSKLEDKDFIVPPIEQQEQFAAFVFQVDKSKVVVQEALEKAQLLFDSLMQQFFG